MAARRADQAPRRIGLQPTLPLSPVPDAVLGAHHPAASLAVQDRQVAHRDAEGPCLEGADAALLDQVAVMQLRFGEWIDSHAESIAPTSGLKPDAAPLAKPGEGGIPLGTPRRRRGAGLRVGTAVPARTLGKGYPL